MTDQQLALKSILDQYAACTLTIEETERKLEEFLLKPQPIFIEATSPMHQQEQDAIRRQWRELLGGRYTPILLAGGLKLSEGQEFRPAELNIECESVSVNTKGNVLKLVRIDGKEINVKSGEIKFECGKVPSVKLEIVP